MLHHHDHVDSDLSEATLYWRWWPDISRIRPRCRTQMMRLCYRIALKGHSFRPHKLGNILRDYLLLLKRTKYFIANAFLVKVKYWERSRGCAGENIRSPEMIGQWLPPKLAIGCFKPALQQTTLLIPRQKRIHKIRQSDAVTTTKQTDSLQPYLQAFPLLFSTSDMRVKSDHGVRDPRGIKATRVEIAYRDC